MSDLPPETEALLHGAREPDRQGALPVGDGHRLYYEESGPANGLPVVCLHGGPGSGSPPWVRRVFDPERFRIIAYDQRGAGRSEPRGELRGNTTAALVEDLEALRRRLEIERWLLFGGSWGATLAIAYAQAHPDRALGLILRGPLLGRPGDLDWFFGPNGAARIFPREYEAFLGALPEAQRETPLRGYAELFRSQPVEAARAWTAWDHRVATGRGLEDLSRANPATGAIACHYAVNGFFLAERGVLDGIDRLRGIPGTIVQGQLDLVCPAENAVTLAEHWRAADLHLVEGAGHLGTEPGIARKLAESVRRFAAEWT